VVQRRLIIDFNPAAERMFGSPRSEVGGKQMAELIVPPSLRDRQRARSSATSRPARARSSATASS
jgi:PAS domain S-box-containing protein